MLGDLKKEPVSEEADNISKDEEIAGAKEEKVEESKVEESKQDDEVKKEGKAPEKEEAPLPELERQSSQQDCGGRPRPPRPPPPKIFGPEDDPSRPVELPPAAEDAPELKLGKRNPKLYQLVSMSQENPGSCSFWWDSVDASAIKAEDEEEGYGQPVAVASFDDSVSVRVVQDDDDDDEG